MIAPAAISLRPLPTNAPGSAAKTWDQIASLLRVVRLTEPAGEPIPLSAPWLSSWSGKRVTESEVKAGKRCLESHGFIEHVGDARSGFPKPTKLWRIQEETTG